MRKVWTPEEIEYIQANYPDRPSEELAKELNVPIHKIYRIASRLKIKKSEAFLKSDYSGRLNKLTQSGVNYRFLKGNISANKGKKMSEEHYKKAAPTMFKKGAAPKNTLYDNAIRVRNNFKRNSRYLYIRISQGNWKELHRYLYEQTYGPLKPQSVVKFKDGNSLNCEIENLYLTDLKGNMIENTIQRYPPEVKDIIRVAAKLKKEINKRLNK